MRDKYHMNEVQNWNVHNSVAKWDGEVVILGVQGAGPFIFSHPHAFVCWETLRISFKENSEIVIYCEEKYRI